MPQQLPPLTTLRSFEASARLLSFSKAADELHVTHGAVSRAVRHLEDHVGVKLFKRSVRAVNLTPTGAAYAASVRDVLGRLATATAQIMDQQSMGVLNISTLDSFAAKWLIPRLFRFRQAHGDIEVRLATSVKLADFVNDGIDIAIRYGSGRYPGVKAELLMREEVFPVCSPMLVKGPHPLKERGGPEASHVDPRCLRNRLGDVAQDCRGGRESTRTAGPGSNPPIMRCRPQFRVKGLSLAAARWSPMTLRPGGWSSHSR